MLLTVKEVAEHLNCKSSTVYAWAKTGKIPSFKLEGLLRFDPNEIEDWIGSSRTKLEVPIKITPQRQDSNDINDLVRRAIVSATKPSYNSTKGKLGLDKAHKRGGN